MLEEITAKARAAQNWFGYGQWPARYWFVGMEPGGSDEQDLSYESWAGLGAPELLDCKEHHDDWNARGGIPRARWHDPYPPIQPTWGPLIRLLLSFQNRDTSDDSLRDYQRDCWGMADGETAVLELSALHAQNMSVDVERTLHRAERIGVLKSRLAEYAPAFAVFYGATYRDEYAKIAGAFNAEGWCWNGSTLCVLTQHPAYRYAPGEEYWIALGDWMREAVEAGPAKDIAGCPQPPPSKRNGAKSEIWSAPVIQLGGSTVPIMRQGEEAGRISYDGKRVLVEERLPNGGFRPLGYYEQTQPNTLPRKVREIDDIFDAWRALPITDAELVKANWRRAEFVPGFAPPANAITIGCTVLEQDGIEIAKIYKIRPASAILVPS